MGEIEEGRVRVDGVEAFYRRVQGEGAPVVYCHGNPTHGEEWVPLMERGGPSVAIDMPGWGRSDRPDPARFDYSMFGLSAFLERCLEELGVERRKLVLHDWGGLMLIGAQRRPELVEKLVVVDAVPLLPGYDWHWIGRLWRRRLVGELLNATTTKASLRLLLRQARGDRGAMPPEFVDLIWSRWDKGTSKAILGLYRGAAADQLAFAGRDLGKLDCPALVLWGDRDPYLPTRFAEAYASALPNSELELLRGVGHWPLVDRPATADRILRFLA